MLYSNIDKYFNRLLRHETEKRHRNLRSDSVLVHTGYISTGALLVPGFGTQPYSHVFISPEFSLSVCLFYFVAMCRIP